MSKSKVSDVVRGGGLFLDLMRKFEAAVYAAGGTPEDIHRLTTDAGAENLADMAKLAVVRTDDDAYAARFAAALKACSFDWVNESITPKSFPTNIFGEIGEAYMLGQPPKTSNGCWTDQEIDAWLAELAKEGYEAATLADGLKYVADNQMSHGGTVIFWSSVSESGIVTYLAGHGVGRRYLDARKRDGFWMAYYHFLLRKVLPR